MIANGSELPMMQAGSAVLDVYFSGLRLRTWLPMRGFRRISDMLNSGGVDCLSATLPPGAVGDSGREVALRLADVDLVRPIEETPFASPSGADYRDRVRTRVVMQMGACQVVGDLYLLDRVRWVDYLPAVQARFVAVAHASVNFEPGRVEPLEGAFVLVNGSRISAIWAIND